MWEVLAESGLPIQLKMHLSMAFDVLRLSPAKDCGQGGKTYYLSPQEAGSGLETAETAAETAGRRLVGEEPCRRLVGEDSSNI